MHGYLIITFFFPHGEWIDLPSGQRVVEVLDDDGTDPRGRRVLTVLIERETQAQLFRQM